MGFIKDKINITCKNLFNIANKELGSFDNIEYQKTKGYKIGNSFPIDGWEKVCENTLFTGNDEHYWIKFSFKTPEPKENISYYVSFKTGYEGQWDVINPQGIIYLNGEIVQGVDINHCKVFVDGNTDYTLHNYLYLGINNCKINYEIKLFSLDELTEQLYYDMNVAYESAMLLNENSDEYISIMSVLEQTANIIDFRDIGSESYYNSIVKAIDFIGVELYEKLCSVSNKPIVHCIGHTHIDVEWLWHRAQTREKVQRSLATVITLMKKYPEYKFMLSQPELYIYLKEEAPEKYEELKALIKEGRFEPEGAMYVEADCNLISGESFVRQILHGKRFFKEEFNIDSQILFLPDVFGYSAALPQILKKSGIKYFVTSKISWNETNTMPIDRFMWEGIDGTEIYTNFITTQDYHGVKPERFSTYIGLLTPSQIKGTWNRFNQKEYGKHTMTTFGHGDGGGGPTKEMLERQRRLEKGIPGIPATKISSLIDYLNITKKDFDEACKKTKRTPKWVGELYLEMHRGTYTSMAKIKRNNRKSEFLLGKAEALSYIDLFNGGSYDSKTLNHHWRKVLHNQFHDIIPGSSIKPVYDGTDVDYAELNNEIGGIVENKLKTLAENVSTSGGLFVYNPLGFERRGPIKFNGKTIEITKEIPAFGWTVINEYSDKSDVTVADNIAENQFYKLKIDECGRIIELYDKVADRQVFKNNYFGNELLAFEDYPREYDNWEISDYYREKMWLLDTPAEIEPIFDGSRAGFNITHKYMNSIIKQHLWIYSNNRRIDFETQIDWQEHHQILKVAFPFDVHCNSATYEIQFGNIERPNHKNTSWDVAKFETCGHKWVDMSENGYGVALLNDCKYGYSANGSTLELSILKCGTYPNPEADIGEHIFTYSLLPHIGDFRDGGVINEAYSLNQPLSAIELQSQVKNLPEEFSMVSCNAKNVIVETIKKAEVDDSMIVRMYETYNKRCNVTLTVPKGFKNAYICDLMENEINKVDIINNTVSVKISNFEILTLKFKK